MNATTELMKAYQSQALTRAIHRILRSKIPHNIPPKFSKPGTPINYFYKSTKQNEMVEWCSGAVIQSHPHYVSIKSRKKRKTNVSFKDIRLRPQNELANRIHSGYVKDLLTKIQAEQPIDGCMNTFEYPQSSKKKLTLSMASHAIPLPDDDPPPAPSSALLNQNLCGSKETKTPPFACAEKDIGCLAKQIHSSKNIDGSLLESSR